MTTPQSRAKSWGYQVETAALGQLQRVFPRLRRVGSPAYKRSAADLVQDVAFDEGARPIRLVVTRDKHNPLLVTMSMADFRDLTPQWPYLAVVVQVKGRTRSWIGTLYRELVKATR